MRFPHDELRARDLLKEWIAVGRIDQWEYEWLYETTNSAKYIKTVPELCQQIINESVALEVTERLSQ